MLIVFTAFKCSVVEGEYSAVTPDSTDACKPILVVTQNKMMNLKMSIICLL